MPSAHSTRPRFHVIAPTGWMNDPCAPCYNPKTKTFHLFYQWNPKSTDWGDISWGHVESKDLLRWTVRHKDPVLVPSEHYDEGGIFTGCMRVEDNGDMVIIYTSARDLPIHWTKEHTKGSESISIITSSDNGKTWHRHASNPVVPHEPSHLPVTGFRDPFVAEWPELDRVLGETVRRLYALVSGGTPDGPNTFLYRLDKQDLTRWTFVAPLVDLPRHHRLERQRPASINGDSNGRQSQAPRQTADDSDPTFPSTTSTQVSHWTGADLGCNWECSTFVTLSSGDGAQFNAILISSEGGAEPDRFAQYHQSHPTVPKRNPRGANWLFGDLAMSHAESSTSPRFSPTTSGLLDHASLYACTIFPHPDGRTIVWGWLIEDDVDAKYLAEKGWTGCLGVPREIFLQDLGSASSGLQTPVDQMSSVAIRNGKSYTLGVRPVRELDQLRSKSLLETMTPALDRPLISPGSSSSHLDIRVVVGVTPSSLVTIHVKHDDKLAIRTSIIFNASVETISVDRSASTDLKDVNTMEEIGPFTLFQQGQDGPFEQLRLRILLDGDVVEVFANDRFSLSTRTYAPSQGCDGVSMERNGGAVVKEISISEMASIGLD